MEENDASISTGSRKQTLPPPSNQIFTTPSDRTSVGSSRQQAPDTTPTPVRFRDADVSNTGVHQTEEEIKGILTARKIQVDQAMEQAIHQALAKYDRKCQGFVQR